MPFSQVCNSASFSDNGAFSHTSEKAMNSNDGKMVAQTNESLARLAKISSTGIPKCDSIDDDLWQQSSANGKNQSPPQFGNRADSCVSPTIFEPRKDLTTTIVHSQKIQHSTPGNRSPIQSEKNPETRPKLGLAPESDQQQVPGNKPDLNPPESDQEDTPGNKPDLNKTSKGPEKGSGKEEIRFKEYQAGMWSEKFEELCAFRRLNGHCHVPHQYKKNRPLAQWVKRQRYQYKLKLDGKRNTLTDERIRLLKEVDFIWSSHDAVWEERFHGILAFKRKYGHCNVPSRFEQNPQLAIWTKRQRREYKRFMSGVSSAMAPSRIEKLNNIGFVWDCRKMNNPHVVDLLKNTTMIKNISQNATIGSNIRPINFFPNSNQKNDHALVAYYHQKAFKICQLDSTDQQPQPQPAITNNVGSENPAAADSSNPFDRFCNSSDELGTESLYTTLEEQNSKKTPRCDFFSFSQNYSLS